MEIAWKSISNKSLSFNKIFGCFPQFWMPIVTLLMPTSFLFGVWLLNIGNQKKHQQDDIRNEKEQIEFIRKIDSINRQNLTHYEAEKKLYQDTLQQTIIKLKMQTKQIDSLGNTIQSLKEENKPKNRITEKEKTN